MLQSLLNGCKVPPQARCACYGFCLNRGLRGLRQINGMNAIMKFKKIFS